MMLNWQQILAYIQANPAVSAALAGMVLSACYILLMVATRLGDVKPGIQAFVLSGVIHIVLVGLWGSLSATGDHLTGGGDGTSEGEEIIVPISEVIVTDEQNEQDPTNQEHGTVFNRIPTTQDSEFLRETTPVDERVALDQPERNVESMEPRQTSLPELAPESDSVEQAPRQAFAPRSTPRSAADANVALNEETSESRTDVDSLGTARGRRSSDFGTGQFPVETEIRNVRRGQEFDAQVKVSMTAPRTGGQGFVDSDSPVRKSAQSEITQRRTGAAPHAIDFTDTGPFDGASEGSPADNPSGPRDRGSKFTRAAPSTLGGLVENTSGESSSTETGLRRRVQEFAPSKTSTTPRLAAMGLGTPSGLGRATERPGISNPDFETVTKRQGPLTSDTYKFRNPRQRKRVALLHGATQESERAVELSLHWLAQHQNPEGNWDADGFERLCPAGDRCWGAAGRGNPTEVDRVNAPHDRVALETAGKQADTGLTALVVLTFLGAGYTQDEGPYADQIDRALRWMIRQQTTDGYLGGKASHYERMYCHGMATYALGEACGMMASSGTEDEQLRQALSRAVRYIIAMQNPRDGGWRYLDGHLANQESDMSMFGWQLMALKSAEIAGVPIPESTRSGMELFLRKIGQGKEKGLVPYRVGEKPKPSMTAEALFCRQVMGQSRDSASSQESIEFLALHPPKQETQDLYHWYYGTLATYQYGGEPWTLWNDRLRDTLVATQVNTGHAAGSWEPRDQWSRHGGRLYSTALSTMCLEVYYRFLPLYQSQDRLTGIRPNSAVLQE
jgi:hypothetical protein